MSLLWSLRSMPALVAGLGVALMILWGARLVADRTRLTADLNVTQQRLRVALTALERAEQTARIHRAHLDRAAAEARHWSSISNDLQQREGQNAPLSPLLGYTAERLYHTPR